MYQDQIRLLQQELEDCQSRLEQGETLREMCIQEAQKVENENHALREERNEYLRKYQESGKECNRLKREMSDMSGVDYNEYQESHEENKLTLIRKPSDTNYGSPNGKKRHHDEDYSHSSHPLPENHFLACRSRPSHPEKIRQPLRNFEEEARSQLDQTLDRSIPQDSAINTK